MRVLQISTVLIDKLFRKKHAYIPVDRKKIKITKTNKQVKREKKVDININ